jgi:glycosyltransferase involved in cell wall biosynthesis
MSLRIAFIAHACRGGGGLFQTLGLLSALKHVAKDEHFLLVCSKAVGFEEADLPEHCELYVYKGKHTVAQRVLFEAFTLPRLVRDYKPHVVYSPVNIGLMNPPVPQALFVRNAYLFYDRKHYPEMTSRMKLRVFSLRYQMRKALRKTQMIFCQTPVVQRRFAAFYNYPVSRIEVLGFPPPRDLNQPIAPAKLPGFSDRNGTFHILCLTHYMPHKNPGILLPLCRKFHESLLAANIRFLTTVTADEHPNAASFLRGISQEPFSRLIRNVGTVSRADVSRYISQSDAVWVPTLLECLPTTYLESMALGVPILAPDLDFARYTCDQAACYYDPWNLDSVCESIMRLRNSPELSSILARNAKLQLQKKQKFPQSWESVAEVVLAQLRKLVGRA